MRGSRCHRQRRFTVTVAQLVSSDRGPESRSAAAAAGPECMRRLHGAGYWRTAVRSYPGPSAVHRRLLCGSWRAEGFQRDARITHNSHPHAVTGTAASQPRGTARLPAARYWPSVLCLWGRAAARWRGRPRHTAL
jgi:hypothetical protein